MELSIGMVLQISIYALSFSAAALMFLEWYFNGNGTPDAR